MFFKRICCLSLLVVLNFLSFFSYAGGESIDNPKYFILHVDEDVEEAKLCDLYIRTLLSR